MSKLPVKKIPPDEESNRQDGFREAFNTHGFGLQYSVASTLIRFRARSGFQLEFVGAEVPVTLANKETHVDFVFRYRGLNAFLIGECKRVNPAYSEWCFATGGLLAPPPDSRPTLDQLYFPDQSGPAHIAAVAVGGPGALYQVGLSVKRPGRRGDGCNSDRDAISQAATQVLRAANGFIQICHDNQKLIAPAVAEGGGRVVFLPVIFTTASLFVSTLPLYTADATSGLLPPDTQFQGVRWLWYEHHLSSSLRADLPGRNVVEHWAGWQDYIRLTARRSVAIVNTEHIAEFLNSIEGLAFYPPSGVG